MRLGATALAASLVAALAAGCSAGHKSAAADKAGGSSTPVVLRLVYVNWTDNGADLQLLQSFADRAAQLSAGRVLVQLVDGDYRAPDEELAVARGVHAGRFDLGWISTRRWDDLGVRRLRALQTPFLVGGYRLMAAVARGPLADRMLAGLDRAGFVGLALVPRALLHPAGPRPLRRPDDYRGLQFLVARSRTTDGLLAAYGASAVYTLKSVTSAGPPGALLPLGDDGSSVETGNVVLYARFATLFANGAAFARLSGGGREAVRRAAADLVEQAIGQEPSERRAARAHCRTGRVVLASPADLAALEHAASPVTARLERDPETKDLVAAIRRLAASTAPEPPLALPRACGPAQHASPRHRP